jgi:hypothetical protein
MLPGPASGLGTCSSRRSFGPWSTRAFIVGDILSFLLAVFDDMSAGEDQTYNHVAGEIISACKIHAVTAQHDAP